MYKARKGATTRQHADMVIDSTLEGEIRSQEGSHADIKPSKMFDDTTKKQIEAALDPQPYSDSAKGEMSDID